MQQQYMTSPSVADESPSNFNNNAMMSKPMMAKKPNVKKMAFEDSDEGGEDSKPITPPPVIRQPPPPVSQPPPPVYQQPQ